MADRSDDTAGDRDGGSAPAAGGGPARRRARGARAGQRNVRAAGGRVVIGGRRRRAARLDEVPPGQRAPVIRAYLLRWGRRPGSRAVALEARRYFGVGPGAALAEIQGVAQHYPVFRIEYAGRAGPRRGWLIRRPGHAGR